MKQANDRKQKLIDLGPDALAEALLNLAVHSDEADDLIEQLIATPKENVQRFKKKLSSLKRRKRFIGWRESAGFSRELEMLLQDLKSGVDDPLTGVELVAAFYEADNTIFEMCDDSSGNIGDVFRYDAKELFVDYAKRCPDKEKIGDFILKVNQKDNYGIRDTLIDCAGECLPEDVIRTMIATLQKWADKEKDEYGKRHLINDTLQALLDVIGHDNRDEVVADEVKVILKADRLRESDAEFLISLGKIDEAELYLLGRAEQLDGNHYGSLLSLAEAMEVEDRHLVTSLIYRSLLISILERGYTKAYPHGIRYLKKLDKLATSVADWKEFNHHEAFKEQIIQSHGRKRSFWSKYEVKK